MRTGRPKVPVVLTDDERQRLEMLARRPTSAQRVATRAKMVLQAAAGCSNREAADHLHVATQTVCRWRERFRLTRLDGLFDEPRPGAPRKVLDDQIEEVIIKTLETKPKDATQWSTRSMGRETHLSKATVCRIWHAFGLKPHREKTFKLSTDPLFVEKVRDIVGLYMDPPQNAIVLCLDEKSQVQALDRSQPLLPMEMDYPEARTHDYVRHGTTSLFAALDAATGKIIGSCHRRHRQHEFLRFLQRIESTVPEDLEIHGVMDNYATHKTPRIQRWLARHPRWHVHFTPTSASWLNMVERFFSEITTKRIRRGSFRSVAALEGTIEEYLEYRNQNPKPFVWTATADDILASLGRLCKRISETGH
jgi:transposase